MRGSSRQEFDREYFALAAPVLGRKRVNQMAHFVQHGDTSTLLHVLAVSYYAYRLAQKLHLRTRAADLVQGALLHDYYLYDWHYPDPARGRWHGFTHPRAALENAQQDFDISPTQQDLIAHHMFPLTPAPPRSREAILVCLVDKACSLWESFGRQRYAHLRQTGWLDANRI